MGATASSGVMDELERLPEWQTSFKDPGLAVDPPIISRRSDCVAYVRPLEGFRLYVRFFDGIVEMSELIHSARAGSFARLADVEEFRNVGIGFGAVMWANELDLAPDAMYQEFKQAGVWVLR